MSTIYIVIEHQQLLNPGQCSEIAEIQAALPRKCSDSLYYISVHLDCDVKISFTSFGSGAWLLTSGKLTGLSMRLGIVQGLGQAPCPDSMKQIYLASQHAIHGFQTSLPL
jgi:hypothetical protein